MKKNLLTEALFWGHLPIVIIWFGLFIVPLSVWPQRIEFHFWFIAIIMIAQLVWSLLIWKKVDLVCPITTWMQYERGYSLKSKKNYEYSYIAELSQRLHVKISHRFVKLLTMTTLIIVTLQYFA